MFNTQLNHHLSRSLHIFPLLAKTGPTTFTFGSPISINTNAYERSHRQTRIASFPTTAHKKLSHSPIFSSIANHIFHPFRHNAVSDENTEISLNAQIVENQLALTLAQESLFFRLPMSVKGKIYGVSIALLCVWRISRADLSLAHSMYMAPTTLSIFLSDGTVIRIPLRRKYISTPWVTGNVGQMAILKNVFLQNVNRCSIFITGYISDLSRIDSVYC